MKKIVILFVALMPVVLTSCAGNWDYSNETGTLSVPWGEKEGTRNPEEAGAF